MLDNVKSKNILKEIFVKIKNKRKINIIKYNKRTMVKLNINKEDFDIYITLKEYNTKYKTNIEDIDIKELNLSNRYIRNEGLKELIKIKFKELKVLNVDINEISDINILEKVNFKELKELNLSYNYISDIDILEKVNFKELKLLDLSFNEISDIDILEKVNFKKLKILDLSQNYISDINILEKVNFEELKKLNLSSNEINENENNSILISLKSKIKL